MVGGGVAGVVAVVVRLGAGRELGDAVGEAVGRDQAVVGALVDGWSEVEEAVLDGTPVGFAPQPVSRTAASTADAIARDDLMTPVSRPGAGVAAADER